MRYHYEFVSIIRESLEHSTLHYDVPIKGNLTVFQAKSNKGTKGFKVLFISALVEHDVEIRWGKLCESHDFAFNAGDALHPSFTEINKQWEILKCPFGFIVAIFCIDS